MTDTYVSIDLETTGLNPKREKIIEIGAVKVIDGQIRDTFSSLVNPARKLESRITELTGIRDCELENAPYIEEILPSLIDFLEDLPLLGHRVSFDHSFLKKAAVDQQLEFEKTGVDTLRIARKCLAELEHKNLDYLCAYYQIEYRAHRALEDAKAAHFLFRKLAELFAESEPGLFEPVPLVFQIKRDPPATPGQIKQLYRLLEKHKIVLNVDIEKMTRSEASRFADKIRSKKWLTGFELIEPAQDDISVQ